MSQATEDHSIITLPIAKRPLTPAERSRAYRARKKVSTNVATLDTPELVPEIVPAPITSPVTSRVTPPSRSVTASIVLAVAAYGLAAVGITINGWFARSLGSTDVAGWLFLAIGVAADLAALSLPTMAARRWRARHRGAAVAGWAVWAATFAFAVTAGIGFASVNITDVTVTRGSVTPAIVTARAALDDAKAARDRECSGGVGRFCRERETIVTDRQRVLDAALSAAQGVADPQITAAVSLVAWATLGALKPATHDLAMLRLLLLALLPQIGGVLLMVGGDKADAGHA